MEATLTNAFQSATGFECDFRVRNADDELQWLHGGGDATHVVDGKIVVASGTGQDITARKQAETHLAETLSQLSATLDSTADGILVASPRTTSSSRSPNQA